MTNYNVPPYNGYIEPSDESKGWKLYQSLTIKDNFLDFIETTKLAYTVYQNNFNEKNSTK